MKLPTWFSAASFVVPAMAAAFSGAIAAGGWDGKTITIGICSAVVAGFAAFKAYYSTSYGEAIQNHPVMSARIPGQSTS